MALAACASTPATAPPTDAAPAAPAPSRAAERIAALLRGAGGESAATIEAMERALGAPDIRRAEGAGASLTYRYDDCALLLVFAADARGAMRLSAVNPGPRRLEEARPTLEQCAASAAARRD